MVFAHKVWRLLVAIKDGLALLFLLLFFLVLFAGLSGRPSKGAVRGGALLLKLDGAVVEEPAEIDPLAQLLSSEAPIHQYRTRDIVHALRTAARDDRVRTVVLDLSRFMGGGLVSLQDVGSALDEVRTAKKPVLAYATAYTDDGVLLAAHASEVWVDPFGGSFVMGPGGNNLYYGRLLEKLKVTAHVFRVGTFKSAVEPWIRNDQSAEARANSQALYASLWESWKGDVAKARPRANIDMATRDPGGWLRASGGDAAKAALAAGLVDRIGDRTTFGKRVAELAGEDKLDKRPGQFAHTSLRSWLAANAPPTPGKPIGVVTVAGEIVDGDAGPGTAGGDRIAELLDDALDDDLAALVVRVDSPGGSVLASEVIRTAIERHKAKGIPVVVSMANLAASGGYWVATPGSRIFAEPATITGSIGIFAVVPSFERVLGDFGISGDGVKTTPISGQPDVMFGLSPAISEMIQANMESGYARFLGHVAKARGKTTEQVDAMAQGQVWDGGTAQQKGLVDQFGGLEEALAHAAKAARLEQGEWHAVYLGDGAQPYGGLLARLTPDEDTAPPGAVHDWAGIASARQAAMLAQALSGAENLLKVRGAQALCLECPAQPAGARQSAARPEGPLGWLALLTKGG